MFRGLDKDLKGLIHSGPLRAVTLDRAFHLSGIFFLTWNIGVSGRGLHGALSSDELSVPVLGGRDTLV